MTDSILNSVKKILGLDAGYTAFDLDVITHINSTFSTLTQLGVGPAEGFMIEDDKTEWITFLGQDKTLSLVKSYVYLKVRMLFDPPTTSYLITAMEKQIEQMEWRINVNVENNIWTNPNPVLPTP